MTTRATAVTLQYVAWHTANNTGKTGDVANHTLRWVKDGTAAAPTNSASEVDAINAPGIYKLVLTATETTCNVGTLAGKSSTADIVIIPITLTFEAVPLTAAEINTEVDTAITDAALATAAALATVDSIVDAILLDTAELQTDDVPGLIAALDTLIDAIKAKTDNLPATPAATGDIPTAAAIADQVWDEAIAGHAIAGSTGEALSNAGAAGTPPTAAAIADQVWDEAIAGHAAAGSAGEALSNATAPALADFFDTNSGQTAGTAVAGSVVGEIVSSITAGGIPGSVEVDDILINDGTNPIEGAAVWITTDAAGTNTVWAGTTNSNGYPKASDNTNPFLDPGTYYLWVQLSGYTFNNPTTKVISL